MRRRWLSVSLAAALLWIAPSLTSAGVIVPALLAGEAERSVSADAMGMEPGQTSSQSNSRSSTELGLFDRVVSAAASTDQTDVFSAADQISEIGDQSVSGDGFADVIGSLELGSAMGEAESFFSSAFSVGSQTLADIAFSVGAFGDGAEGLARIDLLADGLSILAIDASSANGIDDFDSLIEQVMLMEGVVYEIVALASVFGENDGPAGFEASSDFGFSLEIVPEPGTLALIAPGLVVLAMKRRTRRG